ncbi:MAG: UDP-glucose dehydrogenase family protein [Alphaproteobacteria bacterium]
MRIAMIGAGYVGLVSAACFAEFGIEVVCVDTDSAKIEALNKGQIPIYEPGLDFLVASNLKSGRLRFTTNLAEAMVGRDAVFIAVGTPSRRGDGHADISYVLQAAKDIAHTINRYTVVVIKSTVPVGTCRQMEEVIRRENPAAEFDVCSNPEFLREGSAINDFQRPDRVVIGCRSARAAAVMKSLYRPLYLIETPIVVTTPETSEITKYAANAFLATKITFINEMADLCEKVGADVHDVARGIGLDGRIGRKFLHPGPGYGGSCFPKDTLALVASAHEWGAQLQLVESVVAVNKQRKKNMAKRIQQAMGGNINGKTIAILGVTFKPSTDDMRDAPSLDIIPALQAEGAIIKAYDPAGMEEAARLMPGVIWQENAYAATTHADALVILTEWNEFRSINPQRLQETMRGRVIEDLRNIFNPEEMLEAGFHYRGIGRAFNNQPQPNKKKEQAA